MHAIPSIADSVIGVAYLILSCSIGYLAYRKKNDHPLILWAYAAFIIGSGLVHLTNVASGVPFLVNLVIRAVTAVFAAAAMCGTLYYLQEGLQAMTPRQSQEALTAERNRSRFLLDAIPDIVWVAKSDGSLAYYNRRWYEYTGLDHNQSSDWGWSSVCHPDDLAQLLATWQQSVKSETNHTVECRIRAAAGDYRWHLIRAVPYRNSLGAIDQWVGTLTDVHDQRTAKEAQVFEAEEKLRLLVDQTQDYAMFIMDTDGHIQTWNVGASRLKGYRRDEIIGKHFSVFYCQADRDNHVPDKALATAARDGHWEQEGWRYRKDGSKFWANVIISTLRDKDGELIGFTKITRDLTERRNAEERLRDSEHRLQAVFDNSNAAIYVKDVTVQPSRFILVNRHFCDVFCVKKEDAIGRTMMDLFPEGPVALWQRNDNEVLAERQAKQFEEVLPDPLLPPGHENVQTYISVKFPLLYDDHNNITAICGISTDITALKRTQAALQRSNEDLNQFAYVASHDLQEPLRVITGYVQILQRRCGEKLDEDGRRYMRRVVDGCVRMRNLIDDLLDYSRVSSKSYDIRPLDLKRPVTAALDNLDAAIAGRDTTIDLQDMPEARADESRLVQLYQNLIGNALKFRRPDAKVVITIGCESKDDMRVYFVRDNGIGIAPEQIGKLFKIFQRLHTRDEYPGTGIGLAICKKIIERHGGKIWAESAGPGQGTTFYFTLAAKDGT